MNVVRFFELMRGKRANSIGEEIIIIIQLIVIWGLILSFGYIAISDATIFLTAKLASVSTDLLPSYMLKKVHGSATSSSSFFLH